MTSEPLRCVAIAGPLTESDMAELMDAMRTIEQRKPHLLFKAVVVPLDHDPSIRDMEAILRNIFPVVDGKLALFGIFGDKPKQ